MYARSDDETLFNGLYFPFPRVIHYLRSEQIRMVTQWSIDDIAETNFGLFKYCNGWETRKDLNKGVIEFRCSQMQLQTLRNFQFGVSDLYPAHLFTNSHGDPYFICKSTAEDHPKAIKAAENTEHELSEY